MTTFDTEAITELHRLLDDKKARKNYDLFVKRLTASVAKMRKLGLSDLEIGAMIGANLDQSRQPELTLTLAAMSEMAVAS
jgi:hypothetical protein